MQKQSEIGTEELEKGMHPSRARDAGVILAIVALMLLVINSGGLATWTETLPSTAFNLWLANCARSWHELMVTLGPAAIFEALRHAVRGG